MLAKAHGLTAFARTRVASLRDQTGVFVVAYPPICGAKTVVTRSGALAKKILPEVWLDKGGDRRGPNLHTCRYGDVCVGAISPRLF